MIRLIAVGMMAVTITIFAFAGEGEIVEAFEKRFQDWALGKKFDSEYDWRIAGRPGETKRSIVWISEEEISLLIRELFGRSRSYEKKDKVVEEFLFTDMDRDGLQEMVATTADDCSLCPTTLTILKKNPDRLILFALRTIYGSVHHIKDINGNGFSEITVFWPECEGIGSRSDANHKYSLDWMTVLALRNGIIRDVSAEFPQYYQKLPTRLSANIRQLKKELAALPIQNVDALNRRPLWKREEMERMLREQEQALKKAEALLQQSASIKKYDESVKGGIDSKNQ